MTMGGKMSRRKGMRVEYVVINYFKLLGLTATRVPLSGSTKGEKGDIKLEIPGTRRGDRPMDASFLYGEVKARSTDFNAIYAYHAHFKTPCVNTEVDGELVTISTNFHDLGLIVDDNVRCFLKDKPDFTSSHKTASKIARMKNLLKGCEFLVIKGDHKPVLFIRYYGKAS
jgi:hypothetical protein